MDLQYKLPFGKFNGHTLKDVADNHYWYLDMIAKVEWLIKKIKNEMNREDIDYLQKAQNKHHNEQQKRFNNMIVRSYFPCGCNNDWV